MVFSIGPRIVSHFGRIYGIFSTRLMFASLLLLQCGCSLRVFSEPLVYVSSAQCTLAIAPYRAVAADAVHGRRQLHSVP